MNRIIKSSIMKLVGIMVLASCNGREKVIIDFLNNTETKFDKGKFELVGTELVDTIFENNLYKYSSYTNYPQFEPENYDVDSLEGLEVQKEVTWQLSPYSLDLYNHIRYNGDQSSYTIGDQESLNLSNEFLNIIVTLDYRNFKEKLLGNNAFQSELIENARMYDHFAGVFAPDSISKFSNIENQKSTEIHGFHTIIKFRENSVFQKRNVIFDKNNQTIISFLKTGED